MRVSKEVFIRYVEQGLTPDIKEQPVWIAPIGSKHKSIWKIILTLIEKPEIECCMSRKNYEQSYYLKNKIRDI